MKSILDFVCLFFVCLRSATAGSTPEGGPMEITLAQSLLVSPGSASDLSLC